ncbi:MAG: type IV pili methyl-accepting chemotaxis transducer N-terminal domain-containing protein [Burkholderiaceae bacterium]|nr:type IV pili methyl-accepting chemotaxis transducer N-terminal domain-containing protein [Burkholderiaceae bacterium]
MSTGIRKVRSWTLTGKLVATGVTLLLMALGSIGLTLWVAWNLEGGAAAVNEAGRMRMQIYRLALVLQGPDAAQAPVLVQRFDQSLDLLKSGDPSRPLFVPWSIDSQRHFEQVDARWSQLRGDWLQRRSPAAEMAQQADSFALKVDDFVTSIEARMAHWTTILTLFQLTMVILAIASALTLMYAGYLLVLSPVARLKRGLAQVQQGDMAVRIDASSQDEFGDLAAGFNDMARTLESLYGSLEDKVREKTLKLEVQRQRLADLYQVSAMLSQAPTLQAMAQGFVAQVQRISGASAAAVRWSGEANEHYLMLASVGLPAGMSDAEACLDTGACHCGQTPGRAATRVIPISVDQPMPLRHCERAGYKTLVSVPVRLQDRILGELSLYYQKETALGAEELSLLDALASHLASAMESLRAAALEREAAVAQERTMLARELHDSIAQSLAFLKIQCQLLRDAMRRRDTPAIDQAIGEIDAGVRESYADVRELLVHFRTRTSEEDIEPALRTTLSKFEHQTGLSTRLEMQGHGVALAPDVQVQVLHVIQEALSNVRKHAMASEVVLRVATAPRWRFEVHDDGVGFAPGGRGADQTHVGLGIMQERAQRIGAQVSVNSAAGQGCSVVLELPVGALARPPALSPSIA